MGAAPMAASPTLRIACDAQPVRRQSDIQAGCCRSSPFIVMMHCGVAIFPLAMIWYVAAFQA